MDSAVDRKRHRGGSGEPIVFKVKYGGGIWTTTNWGMVRSAIFVFVGVVDFGTWCGFQKTTGRRGY